MNEEERDLAWFGAVGALERKKLELEQERARADKAEAELAQEKAWSNDLAKQCCEMEDALGFKQEQHGKHGEFVPTMGPWKERVRDLIAKEGELEDEKAARLKAEAACAEMRAVLQAVYDDINDVKAWAKVIEALALLNGKEPK